MTSKGNRPDNGMMESFFEILKSEIFYGYEKTCLLYTSDAADEL